MSATIDSRIVEMRFDNKHFESNVSNTLSSLDKLKQSLKLTDASKGLENVNTAARKCDVSPLGQAVETVGLKFNALYSIADQVFRNITNSAMMYGKRIVSALTLDPIKTGFSEYETQINAVQTILANTESKGKTLDDVNSALDELNTYADKTIYNFTEMTRNIGTFTAAGVDLDTSVQAIKGIANLAAVSGSSSQQASTAMYQLSQAMASGTVKLMDWNSVVNAGMGGQVFQDALKETAKVHGVAIDDIIAKQGSFRESLSTGWLTTEILTDTLAKFTGDLTDEQLKSMGYTEKQIEEIQKLGKTANDAATKVKTFSQLFDTLKEAAQSGWTQTWEILVGDFEEAKELLTKISDVVGGFIGKSAEARNELLENWKVMGGREDLIESFKNVFEGIISIVTPIKDAFREMFPPLTSERLVELTKGFKDLTAKLKIGDETADKIKRTFKGFFAVLDISGQIIVAVFKAIGSLFGTFSDVSGGILSATASFGDWLVNLSESIRSGEVFDKVFQGVAKVIQVVVKVGAGLIKFVKEKLVLPGWELFHTLLERIHERMSQVGEAAGGMKMSVTNAFKIMGAALENCAFFKLMQALWNGIVKLGSGIAKAVGALTGGLIDKLQNADFEGIFDFFNTLSFSAIAVFIAKFVNGFSDIVSSVGSFKDSIIGILDSVRDTFQAYQSKLKAEALMKIAQAIAILTASILVLSFIDSDRLMASLGAITVLFGELMGAMAIFSKISGNIKGVTKASAAMISVSSALLVLAVALKVMSTMSWNEVGVGLTAMTAGLVALVASVSLLPERNVKKAASAIKKMTTALLILAVAIKIMSTMSWEEMGIGLITMVAGLGALVGAVNLLPKNTGLRVLGLVGLATAVVILAGALKIMSSMSWEEMGRGLATLAGTMIILVGAINLIPKDMVFRIMGMMGLATAIIILAGALRIMGSMSWEEMGRGLATLAGSLAILAIALNAMKSTIPGAAALIITVAALTVLVPVLSILGAMSWESIAKGLIAIAGAFVIIGVAGKLLKPIIPSMLGLGAAFMLVGIAVLAMGTGLMIAGLGLSAIATGITALITSIAGGATAIVSALTVIIMGIVKLIPAIIKVLGEAIVSFCGVIIEAAPAIGQAIMAIILTVCEVLIECVPVLTVTLLELIVGLLAALVEYTPQIVDSIFQFLLGIIDGIARNIPALIQSLVDLLMSVLQGTIDALKTVDPEVLVQGLAAIGIIAALMAALAAVSGLIPGAMIGVIGMGLVIAELALVIAAIGAFAQLPGLTWLINEGGKFLQAVGTAIGQFIGGIVGGIAGGISDQLAKIGSDLSTFMTNIKPFIEGAKTIDPSVLEGVKALVGVILALTAANILEGIASWITGSSSITKFASELPVLGVGLKSFSDSVAGIVPENIIAAASAAKALADMTNAIPKEGGVAAWFAGENSISKFGNELPILGRGLKGFSDATSGIVPENVVAAANAAKALAEMADVIPKEGGVAAWFAGENSVAKFGSELPALGRGLKGFSDATSGIVPENVVAAANAAKALAEMTDTIPEEGGMKAWFTGDTNIASFADKLPKLGRGLKGFSDSVSGIVPANVTAAANAAKALAEMADTAPKKTDKIISFGDNLAKFGTKLKSYFTNMKGVSEESISASTKAVDAVKDISSLESSSINSAAKAIDKVTKAIKNMADIPKNATSEFTKALGELGKTSTDALVDSFDDLGTKLKKIAKEAITEFVSGIEDSASKAKKACTSMATSCADAIKEKYQNFYNAGSHLVTGFANGISENDYKAAAKARAMAKAAAEAAEDALDINSPSKVFYGIGKYSGDGFVNALDSYTDVSYDAGSNMANSARRGLSDAISKIERVINGDMDMQPTIRPVLDLSDVKSGANSISSLLGGTSSASLLSNVGAISSMMNNRNQKGANNDVVSAIEDLAKGLESNRGDTYNFGNVSYDGESAVADAVKALARAALMDRRV